MSFTSSGSDIALKRNQGTGRFDLDWDTSGPNKGNPKFSDDRSHAVLVAHVARKRGKRPGMTQEEGGYYWDVSGRYGSLLWTLVLDRLATKSQIESYSQDAGQQLIDLKKISSLESYATRLSPGRWVLEVKYATPSGDTPEPMRLTF